MKAALINLDLEKKFDSVWHNGLLFNLRIAGIRGPLFKILQTFLKNRLVRTRLEVRLSLQVQPKQGVPQGSVLSPLLLIFYIAEMLTITTGIKFKYADDTQILVSAPLESALHQIFKRKMVQDMDNSDKRIQNGNIAHELRWTDDFCLHTGK